ncbi:MAG: PAS domain S-box protein [Actinomycetota bacterium]|nr:PAS domain S-box protein [Actinomycetota bacterium]
MALPNNGGTLAPRDLGMGRLFESIRDAVIVADANTGRISLWNPAAEEIFGYSSAEALGMSVEELVPDYLKARHRAGMAGYRNTGRGRYIDSNAVLDLPALRKGGEEIRVELTLSPIEPVDGAAVEGRFVLAIVRDATDRRRAEEEVRHLNAELEGRVKERTARLEAALDELRSNEERLLESEERFRATFEQAAVGMAHVGVDGRWLRVNQKLCDIVGYPREELLGLRFQDITHPEDLETDLGYLRRLLIGEIGTYSMEKRYFRKDGSIVWINLTVSLVREDSGEPAYFITVIEDISQRKLAEEALRMSERRFRTVIEQSPLSIQILSPDGRTLRVNRAFEELWGVTLEDIEGYNMLEDQQLVEKGIMPYIRQGFAGEPAAIPAIAYDPEQTIPGLSSHEEPKRWVRAFIYPVTDEAGNVREVVLMHEDVTERKRAEESLRESEERYRAVVEQSAEGIYLVDGNTKRILETNPALQDMLGYSAEELRWMELHEIVAHDRASVEANVERTLREGKRFIRERGYRRKDGSVVEVEIAASTIDYGGKQAICAAIRDITERKRAEESLRESEERYRAVVEQAGEGIFLFDPRTKRILEANPAFRSMFGYAAEELRRVTLYDLVPQDSEGVDRNVERALEQGYLLVGERGYRRKDGSGIDVEVSGSVISYGGKEVICSVVRDITERKRAEEAMREVREAERARMARDLHDGVLQDLSYTAASMGIMMIEAEGTSLEKQLQGAIDALRRAAQGLRYAVNDLRLEDEGDRPLPILLEHLVERNSAMSRGQALELHVDEGFPSEPLGRAGVEVLRIVQEALTNARRHSGAGNVRVNLRTEEDDLVVEVTDDGRGFAPETAPGVGSRSMRERAIGIGGTVEIESVAGQGTRVRLRVPVPRKG